MNRLNYARKAGSRSIGRKWVLTAGLLGVASFCVRAPIKLQQDSLVVEQGTLELYRWLTLKHHGPLLAIGSFPAFQYLTGLCLLASHRLGIPISLPEFWSACSRLSLFGLIGLFARAGRRLASSEAAWLLIVVLLCGPLLAYVPSTFNELPAAFVTTAMVAAVAGRASNVARVLLFVLAGLTKETAFPLLSLLWLGAFIASDEFHARRDIVRSIISLFIGLVLTIAFSAAFNLIRFGTIWNQEYISDSTLVTSWRWRLDFFVALWLAPNGGVAIFWPTIAAAIISLLVAGWRAGAGRARYVACIAGAALLLLTAGLSCWWVPFGWWSWGPRLMLPWLPPMLYLLFTTQSDFAKAVARRLLIPRWTFIACISTIVVLAIPHAVIPNNYSAVYRFFSKPESIDAPPGAGKNSLHDAKIHFEAWSKRPFCLLLPLDDLNLSQEGAMAGLLCVSLTLLLLNARSHALREPDQEPA